MSRNINRILIIILAGILLMGCVSCTPNPEGPISETPESTPESTPEITPESSPIETPESSDPPETEPPQPDEVTLNGIALSEYSIVCNSTDSALLKLADKLADSIEKVAGKRPEVKVDFTAHDSEKEILCGFNKRVDGELIESIGQLSAEEYLVRSECDFIYLGGRSDSYPAVVAAVNEFARIITDAEETGKRAVSLDGGKKAVNELGRYTVMSYNDGGNAVTSIKQIAKIVKDYKPDLIGFQEFQQIHYTSYYKNTLSEYDVIYYESDGTTYNSQPIFYLKDKFELIDSGRQWLSDTPDVPYSKYDKSDYIRSYTYAVLKDKETGLEFVMVNTHIDYVSAAISLQVAKLLELTERFGDMPMFYTGDFNMTSSHDGYGLMSEAGYLPTYLTAKGAKVTPTMVGGKYTIDFCFADISKITCNAYRVINNHAHSNTASDHYPIFSDISIIG